MIIDSEHVAKKATAWLRVKVSMVKPATAADADSEVLTYNILCSGA